MVFYSRMFIQESLFACFTLAFVIADRAGGDGRRPGVVHAGGRRGRPGGRDQGNVGHRAARRARRLRDRWWSLGSDGRGIRSPTGGGRWRSSSSLAAAVAVAALFYSSFLAAPGGRPRAVSRRRYLPRSRHRSGEPRAAVALLPRPARVLLVRRPHVERGTRPRAGGRRRGDGVGPARSVATRTRLLGALPHLQRRRHHGDLLGHSVQDSVEPAAVLRRSDRACRNRVLDASSTRLRPASCAARSSRRSSSRLDIWHGRRGAHR